MCSIVLALMFCLISNVEQGLDEGDEGDLMVTVALTINFRSSVHISTMLLFGFYIICS